MRIGAGARLSPRRAPQHPAGWREYAVLAWLALVFICAFNPPEPFRFWAGLAMALMTLGGAFVAMSNARLFFWIRP